MCVCVCRTLRPNQPQLTETVRPTKEHRDEKKAEENIYLDPPDTNSRAARNTSGRLRFRFSALRKIPDAAFWLKKNFSRCGPGISKMSDKEDSAAALGDSEKLCVQNPVADPIPAASQRPDNGSHVPSSVNREQIGDVFKDKPARLEFSQQPHHFAEQT